MSRSGSPGPHRGAARRGLATPLHVAVEATPLATNWIATIPNEVVRSETAKAGVGWNAKPGRESLK